MTLEQQVCSLDLAKRLKELGVKQESYFWWCRYKENGWALSSEIGTESLEEVAAFTVAELGEMLGANVFSSKSVSGSWLVELLGGGKGRSFYEKTEANARAKMLIQLIEQGLLKP